MSFSGIDNLAVVIRKMIGQRIDLADLITVRQRTGNGKFRDLCLCSHRRGIYRTARRTGTGFRLIPKLNDELRCAKQSAHSHNTDHQKNHSHFIFPFLIQKRTTVANICFYVSIINTCSMFVNRTFRFFRKNVRFLFVTFLACPLIMKKETVRSFADSR